MHHPLANLEIKMLEKMYLHEIEILKLKMQTGAFWKDIVEQKNKAMELAMLIHEKQCTALAVCPNFSIEVV